MVSQVRKFRNTLITKGLDLVRSPLQRNGYALVFNSATTSALGMLYWAVAARSYSTDAVGLNSAAISAMMFLANISQFSLSDVLNRFIGGAGRRTPKLILLSYLFSVITGLVVASIFILGLNFWTPALGFLKATPATAIWFILAVAMWCVFVLQDSALVGLRQATWVPPENIFYSVIKIILLIIFAGSAWTIGLFTSWTMPLLLLILPVNFLIFRRLVPIHVKASIGKEEEDLSLRHITRFVAGNHASSLVWFATVNIMPLMILQLAGPTANAHFYLPWEIAYTLYLIAKNMGMSLTAEAANDRSRLGQFSYQTLIHTSMFLIPLIFAVVIGAPLILLIFGKSYAAEGVTLLRLMALSAIPNIVTQLYMSIARVQRRVGSLMIVLTSLCGMALGLSYLLVPRLGLTGPGLAWLISQSVVATVLLLTEFRPILLENVNSSLLLRLAAYPRRPFLAWKDRKIYNNIQAALPQIEKDTARVPELQKIGALSIERVFRTASDMTVAFLCSKDDGRDAGVLNLPRSQHAQKSFERQTEVIDTLQSIEALGDWRCLLPVILVEGQIKGRPYWITRRIPGKEAGTLFDQAPLRQQILIESARSIHALHTSTEKEVQINADLLERWVFEPVRDLEQSKINLSRKSGSQIQLERLSGELKESLMGKRMRTSWVHGDYWPGNILVTPDGRSLTGIVDWDQAMPDDLPYLDLLTLIITTRRWVEHKEIGDIILDLIKDATWTPEEAALLEIGGFGDAVPDEVTTRAMLLLYWLRHVRANITKSQRYHVHPLWVAKNYDAVLSRI
jgi:O-antigen/teichoic acid export membrane protein/aminoglycoside phosphotransferase (APT) family kinase protein